MHCNAVYDYANVKICLFVALLPISFKMGR